MDQKINPHPAPEGVDSEFVISFDGHFTDLRYAFRDMLVTVISIATYLFDLVSQTFSILQVFVIHIMFVILTCFHLTNFFGEEKFSWLHS